MRRSPLIPFVFAAFLVALATPAGAQSRGGDLQTLSRIFGELHHIRRTCEPEREADAWRNRMRRLVELEQPSAELRSRMVEAFNGGFRAAQERFPYCDRDARNAAAAAAASAEDVTQRLMAPLYDSLADQGIVPPPATTTPIPQTPAPPQPN